MAESLDLTEQFKTAGFHAPHGIRTEWYPICAFCACYANLALHGMRDNAAYAICGVGGSACFSIAVTIERIAWKFPAFMTVLRLRLHGIHARYRI